MQLVPCSDRRFDRSAAGGYLEVRPFDFHRDGSAATIRFLTPSPAGSGANGRIWPAMMSAELPEGWV